MGALKEHLQEIKKDIVDIEQSLGSMEMLRDKIRAEFKLDEMRARLLAIPGEIEALQKEGLSAKEAVSQGEESMKEHEAELMFEISQETNGDKDKPKPKFSNDTARKAELTRRLKDSTDYQKVKVKVETFRRDQVNTEIDIDRLRNDFRVQMAFKDLACAEMNLLGV